jgi:hypothetical protein
VGNCTNSPSLLNLFNTAAIAEQSSSNPDTSTTASAGCDGEVVEKNKAAASLSWDLKKLVCTEYMAPPFTHFWKVMFP